MYKPTLINALKLVKKAQYLMIRQAERGVLFDQEKAKKLLFKIDVKLDEIAKEVEPQLPRRQLSESCLKKPPKNQFKKDGQPSALAIKYFDDVKNTGTDEKPVWTFNLAGERVPLPYHDPLVTTATMTLANQKDLKVWLLDEGWSPIFWNYKKDSSGKFLRDSRNQLIKASPKLQEAGVLCPNLDELSTPIVKKVITWLSLRNRRSTLESLRDNELGWLNNSRLLVDGRLPASTSGPAVSWRQKHRVVVNVPKAQDNVLLGKAFRSLFISIPGFDFIGWDAAGLEARVMAHYTYQYDGGELANLLLERDWHSVNAIAMFPDKVGHFDMDSEDFNNEHPEFKPWRSQAKNCAYALIYGCSVPKLAKMLGVDKDSAQVVYESFWDNNPALKQLKENLVIHWKDRQKKTIVCPVSGAVLHSRSEHSLLNLLFQHTGSFIMDMAGILMDKWLGGIKFNSQGLPCYYYKGYECVRLIYMHDEYEWESQPEITEDICKLGELSIKKAGEYLNLNVALDAEAKVGINWKEVH